MIRLAVVVLFCISLIIYEIDNIFNNRYDIVYCLYTSLVILVLILSSIGIYLEMGV